MTEMYIGYRFGDKSRTVRLNSTGFKEFQIPDDVRYLELNLSVALGQDAPDKIYTNRTIGYFRLIIENFLRDCAFSSGFRVYIGDYRESKLKLVLRAWNLEDAEKLLSLAKNDVKLDGLENLVCEKMQSHHESVSSKAANVKLRRSSVASSAFIG